MADLLTVLRRLVDRPDERVWEALVARLGSDLHRVASSATDDPQLADDAVQEALLYIRDHAGDCRAGSDAGARAWCLRIGHRAALQIQRRQRSRRDRDRRAGERESRRHERDPQEQFAQREEHALLRRELQALPERHREPLVLHFLGELDYAAVGEALSCSAANARLRVHRALKHLRQRVQRVGITVSLLLLGKRLSAAVPADPTVGRELGPLWHSLLHADHQVAWQLPAAASAGGPLVLTAKIAIAATLCAGIVYSQAGDDPAPMPAGSEPARVDHLPAQPDPLPEPVAGNDLDQPVALDFQEASAAEVIAFLRNQGLTVTVDKRVELGSLPPVSFKTTTTPLGKSIVSVGSLLGVRMRPAGKTAVEILPAVEAVLQMPVTIDFQDLSLVEALAFLDPMEASVSIAPHDALQVDALPPVTMQAQGITLGNVLSFIATMTGTRVLIIGDQVLLAPAVSVLADPDANNDGQPQPLAGEVVAVRNDMAGAVDLVMLSVGADDGVAEGMEFIALRGNQYIVKLRAEKVLADMTACRVLPETWNAAARKLQQGDQVQNRLF